MGRAFTGRINKENYYLGIAQTVAGRSTCLRRCYGAILIKSDEIISTSCNGASRRRRNCVDLDHRTRKVLSIPSGERYELCHSVHAGTNIIISAARRETLGTTLYVAYVEPNTEALIPGSTSCSICRHLIINAGIEWVVIQDIHTEYRVVEVADWVWGDDSLPRSLRGPGPQKLVPNGNVLDRGPPQT